MAGQIFISYSRKDDAAMRRIVAFLRKQGINVWVDNEKLVPGTPIWEEEIEKAIHRASAVVVMLSPDSKKSVWVRREISFAERYHKRIFPVLVTGDEDSSITLRLITSQYVDIRQNEDISLISLSTELSRYLQELQAQEQREAAEKAEQEIKERKRLAREEKARKEKEAKEKNAREKVKREAAEKIAREKAERAAREKAEREVAEKNAREKTARQKIDKEARGKAIREATGKIKREAVKSLRKIPTSIYMGLIIIAIFVAIGYLGIRQNNTTQIPNATSTANTKATSTPRSIDNAQSTANAIATSTAKLNATSTANARSTANANARSTAWTNATSTAKAKAYVQATENANHEPVAQIVSIECGSGLSMDVHIRIISDTGISAYAIWETWFVGNNIERSFSPPLPKEIDGTIRFEHFEPDSVDRNHQIGLRVEIPNNPNPIFTYAMEPNNRCPGHYQP